MGEIKPTAHLRELKSSGQCELKFPLHVELDGIGLLQEEIRAVRQQTDTVGSLLQHIVNKINKSIATLKEKKNINTTESKDIEITLDLKNLKTKKSLKSNMVLKDLITSNMKNIGFIIFNQSFCVIINAPLVREIKLPRVIYSNFDVQPQLHILFGDNRASQFYWYKSKDKTNWTPICNGYRYKTVDDDVGHYLKIVCIPSSNVLMGPPSEAVSENKVEQMRELPTCPFEERHKFTPNKLKDNQLRVVSYNVLSNRYVEINDQFSYCSPKALAPDYRKQLIAKELLGYNGDIICLQEVDSNLYTSFYKQIFKENEYMSFYHRKGNKVPEGLACFFNKSRFKKIEDFQITYSVEIKSNQLFKYLQNIVNKNNEDLKQCFMKQMTSLQITILKLREDSQPQQFIIVANTHLFYHPDAELVRILQVNIATTYINDLHTKYSQNGKRVDVIFCGDFNCKPASAVYDYMVNGGIRKCHKVFEKIVSNIDLYHRFNFISACGIPKYTNYTKDFKDCLDYIFIEKDKMNINTIVPLPTEEKLAEYEGLPNDVYPSDHLALVVDLEII